MLLTTPRCVLTRPRQQDVADLTVLYLNPQVRQYLGGPVDTQLLAERLATRLSTNTPADYWVIRRAPDEAFIGSVSLDLYHDGINTEISYQLLPQWWRHGYATEVVQRVLQYAFKDLDLRKVVAETQTANTASCRLLEKVGMRLENSIERFGAEQTVFSISR